MSSAVERVVATYIRACSEREPARREQLLAECFAEDGRLISRSREVRGRAGMLEMLARFHADPQVLRVRQLSAIDAGSSTFRFRGAAELRDGTLLESLDTGLVDASGKISLVLTFAGPLGDAGEPASAP